MLEKTKNLLGDWYQRFLFVFDKTDNLALIIWNFNSVLVSLLKHYYVPM